MKKSDNFEDNIKEIDEIIENLESGNLSLDESIKEYSKAMKLIKSSSDILNKAEGKILKIVKDTGVLDMEEFNEI